MKLYDEYMASLKMKEVEEFFDLTFYRPLAFLFVKAVYHTELTPNQITLLSMLAGVLAGVAFGVGGATMLLAAGVLLIVNDVLDCSDGQLARLKKNGTRIGRILDGVADYIVAAAVYLGMGIGFASTSDDPLFWWMMILLAAGSNAVHSIQVDYYRNRYLDIVLQRVSTFEEDLEAFEEEHAQMRTEGGHWFERIVIVVYLRYSRFQRKLTSGNTEHAVLTDADPEEYRRANRRMIKLWLFLGPTSQITWMVICAFLNRLDVYVYGLVIGGNLWALLLYPLQRRINHRFKVS
ncbi:CDP-alcohol phosphatidyltransferase family protein [bacterium]|nr:CDP-alcohol phosphatidyltransferase family protein [bacterium]